MVIFEPTLITVSIFLENHFRIFNACIEAVYLCKFLIDLDTHMTSSLHSISDIFKNDNFQFKYDHIFALFRQNQKCLFRKS